MYRQYMFIYIYMYIRMTPMALVHHVYDVRSLMTFFYSTTFLGGLQWNDSWASMAHVPDVRSCRSDHARAGIPRDTYT